MNEAKTSRANTATPPSAGASQWRLFCAIELTAEVRARMIEHISLLRAKLPDVRAAWERADKLHLTLKFFGDVEQARIEALSHATARAAHSIAPFNIVINGAGAFPPHGNPRVLWLGLNDSTGNLSRLHQTLENECTAEGFKREQRPFHPHITLARLRHPAGTRQLAALHLETGFPAMQLNVTEIVLMRSEPGPGGSRYTALSRQSLG
jgi:2'-5' RNA ligase